MWEVYVFAGQWVKNEWRKFYLDIVSSQPRFRTLSTAQAFHWERVRALNKHIENKNKLNKSEINVVFGGIILPKEKFGESLQADPSVVGLQLSLVCWAKCCTLRPIVKTLTSLTSRMRGFVSLSVLILDFAVPVRIIHNLCLGECIVLYVYLV